MEIVCILLSLVWLVNLLMSRISGGCVLPSRPRPHYSDRGNPLSNQRTLYLGQIPPRKSSQIITPVSLYHLPHEADIIKFGISNFRPSDVQRIYNIQAEAQSVLPTVYQGCYNALARHAETDLFPLLRDHGINFYAYSPIAGGFLAKRSSQLHEHNPEDVEGEKAVEGRFGAKNMHGEMYRALYCKPAMLDALDEWNTIAKDAGIGGSALAYRWVRFHSSLGRGDAVVIGARSVGQLRETLEVMDAGPLDEEVAERVEGLWEGVRGVAPRDNWDGFLKRKVVR